MYSNSISSQLAFEALRAAVATRSHFSLESPLGTIEGTLLVLLDGYLLVRRDDNLSERWDVAEVLTAIKADLFHIENEI